jgi:hypothetical protein
MTGPLASFDVLPPEQVDRVLAWCFIRYPASGRDAAIAALREKHGIPAETAVSMVDAAIARSASWSRAQALALADEAAGWDEPVPLSAVAVLPDFPVTIYPQWLSAQVTALAEFTQTPGDLGGVVALSVLAAALGGRARIEIRPGWQEPLNLYATVALPSGSRKSTVHATLTAPLLAVEAQMAAAAGAAIAEARTARAIAEKAAAQAAAKAAAAEQGEARDRLQAEAIAMAGLAESIGIPVPPRFVADDIGPEKAAQLLAEQGGRLAIMSAEGGPFVSLASRYTREPNLEVFLKGWSGDMLRVDRIGRAPDHVPHPALTLGLTVQPAVLRQIFGMPGFHGRGLLARVLYSMPVSTVGRRRVRTAEVPWTISAGYIANMGAIIQGYAAWTDPAVFRLTPGAAEMLCRAAEALEPRLAQHGGDLGHMADWGGKLTGTIARIAGLLHAAEHIQEGYRWPVSEGTMARALAAGQYFTEHARAVFDFMGADPATEDAREVLAWIKRNARPQFSKRDLHRGMIARFRKAADVDAPLEMLAANGWIRQAGTATPGKQGGRPPSAIFEVHPSLLPKAITA